MRAKAFIVGAALLLAPTGPAVLAEAGGGSTPMMSHGAPDARQLLDFPAPMREHMLVNMRGHLEAMGEIMAALASGDGVRAGKIAESRLGLGSANAAACVKGEAAGGMAAMMAQQMPQEMRALGLAMHEAASSFATRAAALKANEDIRPAVGELARVSEACAACHSAYRLR